MAAQAAIHASIRVATRIDKMRLLKLAWMLAFASMTGVG